MNRMVTDIIYGLAFLAALLAIPLIHRYVEVYL